MIGMRTPVPVALTDAERIELERRTRSNVSIGSGYSGFFKLVNIDLNNYQQGNSFLSLITLTGLPIATEVFATPIDITKSGITYLHLFSTNVFSIIKANSEDDNYFTNDIEPFRCLLVELTGAEDTVDSVMYMNFTQATQFRS
jgi:hypothetical protein